MPSERKRRNFTFRSTEAMRAKLGAAAEASGRSISEEIELRLELSFDRETRPFIQSLLSTNELLTKMRADGFLNGHS